MGSEIHIKIKLKVIGKPKWRYLSITEWIYSERLTLSYNEMLRGKNTGRDRKKVKKLIYYYLELIKKRVTNGQIAFFVLYGKCI